MKMNKTLLLKASAFFLLLITLLFSCGIPTYFYVTYSFSKPQSSNSVTGNFSFIDTHGNLSWIDPGTGPSLLLSYIVTYSQTPPSFSSLFSSTYKRSNNNGIPVDDDLMLTSESGAYIYRLHRFSDENGIEFSSPEYVAYANTPSSPDLSVTLTKAGDNYLDLSFTSGNYSLSGSSRLARFDGKAFITDTQTIRDSASTYKDYTISDTEQKMYCHVFAAVNVSQGDFTNNFWTDLQYMGYIELN